MHYMGSAFWDIMSYALIYWHYHDYTYMCVLDECDILKFTNIIYFDKKQKYNIEKFAWLQDCVGK